MLSLTTIPKQKYFVYALEYIQGVPEEMKQTLRGGKGYNKDSELHSIGFIYLSMIGNVFLAR